MDVLATRTIVVRTNGTEADAKACGPGLPTLRPSPREMVSRAMGAIKPGSQLFDSHISELQSGPVFDAAEGFEA